jgi:hypothetical protein
VLNLTILQDNVSRVFADTILTTTTNVSQSVTYAKRGISIQANAHHVMLDMNSLMVHVQQSTLLWIVAMIKRLLYLIPIV